MKSHHLLFASVAFIISMALAMAERLLWVTLAASTLAIVLPTSPASAEVIQLQCQSNDGGRDILLALTITERL